MTICLMLAAQAKRAQSFDTASWTRCDSNGGPIMGHMAATATTSA